MNSALKLLSFSGHGSTAVHLGSALELRVWTKGQSLVSFSRGCESHWSSASTSLWSAAGPHLPASVPLGMAVRLRVMNGVGTRGSASRRGLKKPTDPPGKVKNRALGPGELWVRARKGLGFATQKGVCGSRTCVTVVTSTASCCGARGRLLQRVRSFTPGQHPLLLLSNRKYSMVVYRSLGNRTKLTA